MMRPMEPARWWNAWTEPVIEHLRVAEVLIADAAGPLDPLEQEGIAGASQARQLEFRAGRCVARELLRGLGALEPVVLRARDRSPVWPLGFVGSIAHTDTTCLVVVARSPWIESVGVDIEPNEALEEDLFADVATPRERAWLASVPASRRGHCARRLFAAKEAVYKCLHPIDQEFLGFHDVEIDFTELASPFAERHTRESSVPDSRHVVDAAHAGAPAEAATGRSHPALASFRVRCNVSPSSSDARIVGWSVEDGGFIRAFACLPSPRVASL